jgi:hypothetical protein
LDLATRKDVGWEGCRGSERQALSREPENDDDDDANADDFDQDDGEEDAHYQ